MSDQSRIRVECVVGDIAQQSDVDAVVNAANAQLRTGGGVAGALHRAAGPGLAEEGRPMAPIAPGQAVLTGGHNLPNRWVIHCLGPVYGVDKPEDQLLAGCYRNALKLADEHGIERLAFPALSTGAFGYPAEAAAQVCAATLETILPTLHKVTLIRFVLFNEAAGQILQEALAQRLTIDPLEF
ncbi:macro domain-containing protein [Halomonas sp. ISL-60]|uniref:macro domain-containing protein n=1 Tax=unclassified Halomonas TaxID=2609666 RepID=UPI0007D90946|nr:MULTISPECIES: macro domain-containing protein [unclassified Halomonas]MBT2774679.1 macro domain-containing protein [Halomonas sp. ISL-60]MBT2788644.1 macro domain-containing protein [Halomonas sp. ISL-106]MBT2798235.1 macro domain-containing protein [Halomonas sp. ISL-104]MBT2803306.1 macro domain-containing protein [Halomonas sp. ISL-56]OAL60784.1 RNase III inhibitor [Halomonas sp. ALS9]